MPEVMGFTQVLERRERERERERGRIKHTCISHNIMYMYIKLSSIHFVLLDYTALFARLTLRRTFRALYGTFCTSHSQAYISCSIRHFLHVLLSGVHFVLYTALFARPTLRRTFRALFAHQTLKRTFCALYGTFCTSNSQAYISCSIWQFLYIKFSSVHFVLYMAVLYETNITHVTYMYIIPLRYMT